MSAKVVVLTSVGVLALVLGSWLRWGRYWPRWGQVPASGRGIYLWTDNLPFHDLLHPDAPLRAIVH